jgi:hypothetical protein
MTKPIASLSLDLDNKWTYMRTHGVAGWDEYPSYLDVVVPRILQCCDEHGLRITCFVVGRDAQQSQNRGPLASLAAAGHEIGNHSLNHFPWMHTLGREQVEAEICEAESYIELATGQQPIGFRGPGYSISDDAIGILAKRGYSYDASTLPTYIGPLARWYFRRTATAEAAERATRRELLGVFRDAMRPVKPYIYKTDAGSLVEIPVTTFPCVKLPIHMTYLVYLWQYSPPLTRFYIRMALSACRGLGIGPSILLHPLDFLGCEDEPDLSFFPGMKLRRDEKRRLMDGVLTQLTRHFDVVPMQKHAKVIGERFGLVRTVRPPWKLEKQTLVAETSNS